LLGEFLAQSVFYEMAALLVLAALVGFVGQTLRQPLVVSFIAVGILAGPSALGIARSEAHIDLLAELGIAVLLFLVGLKLDLGLVRRLGRVALMTGLGQVGFTAALGFVIGLGLGLGALTSLYVAVALTFSSTIIIVKLLSDKKEIDSLHGQIALGFLIVQDVVVVLAMIVLSAMGVGGAGDGGAIADIALVLLYGGALLTVVMLFVRFVASPLVERLAETPELLVAFALGWTTLLAAVGHYLGFGKELGGLLAGVSLASTPYREALAGRLASLRDFLLLFFFIGLGASLDLSVLGAQVGPAAVFSLFVLIGNPLIVLVVMGAMGYRKRTGFLAGLTVAQISEFSLIFMAMGLSLGHVDTEALGLGGLKRSSQQPHEGGCDGDGEAALEQIHTAGTALAGPAARGAARTPTRVLDGDRGGAFERRRRGGCRGIACRGNQVVPGGRRHGAITSRGHGEAAFGALPFLRRT